MATMEERMKILQMVQEGKITPEDAAQLLEAINVGSAQAAFGLFQVNLSAAEHIQDRLALGRSWYGRRGRHFGPRGFLSRRLISHRADDLVQTIAQCGVR